MLKVSAQTNIGKTRSVNQDSVFVSTDPWGLLPNLFIVADGMGGHNGGEIASKTAISQFCGHIKIQSDQTGQAGVEEILDLLTSAALAANAGVLSMADASPELTGMGTTLTACTIDEGGKCNIIHIGDSRAYVIASSELSSKKITQVTHDHSFVNEMVKAGQITQNEAREHPKRNVLTKVLGINPEMSADGYVIDTEPGSIILLCSDGLYNMVPEDEILSIVNENEEPAITLIETANDRGGTDNISVVIIEIVQRSHVNKEVIP